MAALVADDVIYQDRDICILKPDSVRGVPVFHSSSHPGICLDKLYSYNGLRKAKPELRLTRIDSRNDPQHFNYIYFRAPYKNTGGNTFESYYGETPEDMVFPHYFRKYKSLAIIKVDPEKTFVYFSEARAAGTPQNVINSRMPLSEYLERIKGRGQALDYSGVSYSLKEKMRDGGYPTNRMWEVILNADFLDRSAYVCVENTVPFEKNSTMQARQAPEGGGGGGGIAEGGRRRRRTRRRLSRRHTRK